MLQLGEPKDVVRTAVRTIIQLVSEIVTPAKIFPLVLDGLKNKNARQRTECLQVLEQLLDASGMAATSTPSVSALTDIASFVSLQNIRPPDGSWLADRLYLKISFFTLDFFTFFALRRSHCSLHMLVLRGRKLKRSLFWVPGELCYRKKSLTAVISHLNSGPQELMSKSNLSWCRRQMLL